nr:hypothetical protein [Actinokineospora enzanensis]
MLDPATVLVVESLTDRCRVVRLTPKTALLIDWPNLSASSCTSRKMADDIVMELSSTSTWTWLGTHNLDRMA